MVETHDFSSWREWKGASEGSGRSEKIWLSSDSGQIGLFKYPKQNYDGSETTEHISEHLAYRLGTILGVQTAKVDIGKRNGRIGSMSYLVKRPSEVLIEGINFISVHHPGYDMNHLVDKQTGQYYGIDFIEEVFRPLEVAGHIERTAWIGMMLFDFLIGNRDRHHSNWAILVSEVKQQKGKTLEWKFCPLYDNGSSLCCYVTEEKALTMFGKDKRPFQALVGSKSRSMIRIDSGTKVLPEHSVVVRHLLRTYPETDAICRGFLTKLDDDKIGRLLQEYPSELLSPSKNNLIQKYLSAKLEILNNLVEENEYV